MNVIIPGHNYEVSYFDHPNSRSTIQFIHKEKNDAGELVTICDGTTNEEVLKVLIHRLNHLQGILKCRENAIAITHIETALLWLEKRTLDRIARGVEGTPDA